MKKEIKTDRAPGAIGPYSQGIEAGGLLFLSGQVPIVPQTGEVLKAGIKEQTKLVLSNISELLKTAGLGFKDVVKTTVFIKDMNDFAAVNEVYAQFFEAPYPARSCVEVARLPKDVGVEIEIIAKSN
jgi:putative endoribonuclease L-PSP